MEYAEYLRRMKAKDFRDGFHYGHLEGYTQGKYLGIYKEISNKNTMIKPLGVHVLVEPLEEKSSMVMPELSKGQAEKGIIRGIGSKVEDEELKVGDVVIYRKYSPEEYELGGKTVYLIEEADLFGIEYGETESNPS